MRAVSFGCTKVCVHGSLFLLLGLLALTGRLVDGLTLFGLLLAHELAHVAVALKFGLTVERIELTPIGGTAHIAALLEADPLVESMVAVAGPLSNAALALLGWAAAVQGLEPTSWWHFFLVANLWLGLFNMLPALPLDGGRLYRSWLMRRVGYRRATRRAAFLSRKLALVLFGVGLVGLVLQWVDLTWPLLAIFLYVAARREEWNAPYVLIRYLAAKRERLQTAALLPASVWVLAPDVELLEVGEELVPHRYHIVWVVDRSGRTLGMLTEIQILDAFFRDGPHATVGDLAISIEGGAG